MSAPVKEGEILAGKYQVERVLGTGGMGVVVAAKHLQLEQRVALKFLLAESLNSPDTIMRFEREARAAVRIQSEHVAKVLDVGKLETGAPYMVMEYLTGNDLADVLKLRGTITTEEAIDWMLQTCEAMAEAHLLGIVHRDLKPRNLFITRRTDGSSAVKVLDFGISKSVTAGSGDAASLTSTTAVMGSPLYMSPEQLRSSRDVDAHTDIWALGIILYEILTGNPPFMADSMPQLVMTIVGSPMPPIREARPDLPEGLEAVIQHCLEKDPSKRFDNVAQLARALGEFASPRGRMSVERVSRILSAQPETAGEWSRKSDNNQAGHAGSQTSTAWSESQGMKRPSALPAQGTTGNAKIGTDPAITQPPSTSNTGRNMAIGVGVAGLLLIAGFATVNGQKASAAAAAAANNAATATTATTAEPAGAKLTAVKITATPAEAKIFIDDTLVAGNPATAKFRTDGASHALRIEAPGFVAQRQMIAFDKESLELSISLNAEPAADTSKKPLTGAGKPAGPGPAKGPGGKKGSAIDTNNPYP
jgi:serine/threonine-protein kinase